jgi:hypothetical protein
MRFVTGIALALTLALEVATEAKADSQAVTAMQTAATGNKYIFLLFFDKQDAATDAMKATLETAVGKMPNRAAWVAVDITDPAEKPIVDKFRARGGPMPVTLAVAPNGAPTKAFPKKLGEDQLKEAFVSPCTAKCIKAIFEQRSILLCVQSQKTQANKEATDGATAFKNDPKYTKGVAIIMLDPTDKEEQGFLKDLEVDSQTPTAVTVLVMPPGAPVARFTGALTKENIEEAVEKAATSCPPGCKCH